MNADDIYMEIKTAENSKNWFQLSQISLIMKNEKMKNEKLITIK